MCVVIINSQKYYPMRQSYVSGAYLFCKYFLNMSATLHVFIHLAELIVMFSKRWFLMLTFREGEFIYVYLSLLNNK